MNRKLHYQEVKEYLEKYSTEVGQYDFNGLLHLILAGTENLRQNGSEQDLIDYAHSVSEEHAQFLRRLLASRPQSIREFESDS